MLIVLLMQIVLLILTVLIMLTVSQNVDSIKYVENRANVYILANVE